jgi:hypothetical protein
MWPQVALPWGFDGHETIGAIADRLIPGTNAATQVRSLLLPGETLAGASIWADCAKGYCGPLTPEMNDFINANPRHQNYHFTDVPVGIHEYVAGTVGTDPDDVVQILGQTMNVLRGRADATANPHAFTQRQAVLLLIHMVGDIHQPLHVGSAYISSKNEITAPRSQADIDSGIARPTLGDNYLLIGSRVLHAYWDVDVVKQGMERARATTPAEYATFLLAKYPVREPEVGDIATWPVRWANESLQLADEAHRGLVVGDQSEGQSRNGSPYMQWRITISSDYAERSTADAEQQLAKAGKRLANVLTTIWP